MLRIFASLFIRDTSLSFSLHCPYPALVSVKSWPHKMSLAVLPPIQIFFGIVWRLSILYPAGFTSKTSDPGLFLCWEVFDYWFNVIGLVRFSVSSRFSPVGCMFLGIYPFLLCCSICWYISVHRKSYDSMYFCIISCNIAFFITHSLLSSILNLSS